MRPWSSVLRWCVGGMLAISAATAWAGDVALDGAWRLQITAEGASFAPLLKLKTEGDKISGLFLGDDGVENEITEAALSGNQLCFTLTRDFGGTPLVANYKVDVDGDKLAGTVDYDIGGQTGQAKVEGERQVPTLTGKWNVVATSPDGQTFEPTLLVRQSEGALQGTYIWIDGTEVDLTGGTIEGDQAKFDVAIDFGGQTLKVNFHGKVDGDKFTGQADYDLDGQTGTVDFEGTRDLTPAAVAGDWKIVISSPDGQTLEPTVKIVQEGDEVSGVYTWIDGTEVDIKEAKVNGSHVNFKLEFDFQGTALAAVIDGVAHGDKMMGAAMYDVGGQTGTLDFTATRGGSAGSGLAGTWNFTLTMESGQSAETSLELKQDGDKTVGTYRGPLGEAQVSDAKLEGDQLSFTVTRERDGVEINAKYSGTVKGDEVEGTVEFEGGGQSGTAKFTGKRAAE